uniref:Secreted RxLR effector protein 147 n=1 Tax=Plasmopara viticola TaxID=143451 RepID=RL147_PLAVT|nr:RecName: Full=Secreted RxLR effector protein 147; Flags: Precursor [Plasmopara viticola]
MRGAFYVTTALLITNSIRTAAEANPPGRQPMSHHDGVVPGKSSPRRFLQGSHEPHDKFAVSAANEERMPEPSAKITASLSEEALDTVRKAAHFTFDLNAPPEETPTGMVEAYQVLRQKDPRTVTASHPKRTAEALTSLDEALGYANPKYSAGGQSKKLRTSVSFKATEVRNSISRDRMTPTPRTLSDDDVQNVHKLYMEHLERNLAVFAPTVGGRRE